MKTSVFLLFSLLMIANVSCQKNNDHLVVSPHQHDNEIIALNGTPLIIDESTFRIDDHAIQAVGSLSDVEIDGTTFIVSNITAKGQFAVSLDDTFLPDGAIVFFRKNETSEYIGQNFLVTENNTSITLTGQVSDGTVSKNLEIILQESQFEAGNSEYTIEGNIATLSGSLGNLTYNQILEINANHPQVNTIELGLIDGSVNDEINVQTGRLIRTAGYRTHLKSNSMIFSGGVDLFCSGKTRTMEAGAVIGVHSWCCHQGLTADQLPIDSEGHDEQLDYFTEMLGETTGRDFYFFTINAAPFDDIHQMSTQEIHEYDLLTN